MRGILQFYPNLAPGDPAEVNAHPAEQVPVDKHNGPQVAHRCEQGHQEVIPRLVDKEEDHQGGEEFNGHRPDGDGGHLLQPPVHKVRQQGVGAHGDQVESVHQHLAHVRQGGGDESEQD